MFKGTYIYALFFAFGLSLAAPIYAQHADDKSTKAADGESEGGKSDTLEQPEKEKTEEEKRKEQVDNLIKDHIKALEEAGEEKLSDEDKANLEKALAALLDPNGSLEGIDMKALGKASQLLRDQLDQLKKDGKDETTQTKLEAALKRGSDHAVKVAKAQMDKIAQGMGYPSAGKMTEGIQKFAADPKTAVSEAARSLGKSIADQSNAKAADAKPKDGGGWAGTIGATAGALLGGSMFGSAGAVIGGMLGYGAGSYVDNQAQQAGGYANYAGNVLGGTNYTNPSGGAGAYASPSASSIASGSSFSTPSTPVETTPSILAGETTAGQFALNSGAAASSRTAPTSGTAGFPDTDTVGSDLGAALSQATRGQLSRPGEYGPSSGASATTPTTSTAEEEPSFQASVAAAMEGMSGNQVETAVEVTQEPPTAQGKLAGATATNAVLPTVVPAANAVVASGATQAAAAQAATQASIDAAKLPEAVARKTASDPAKVDEDSKAAPVIARTDGIYADVKKAPGEKNPVALETASYSAPANPGGSTAGETDSPSETKVTSSVPESTVETALTYTRNAVESLMRTGAARGLASTTEPTAPTTAAPLPGKLTIAGLTNPQISEATVKAFQEALPSKLPPITTLASKIDRKLLDALSGNDAEMLRRSTDVGPKTKPLPSEPSPNAIVRDLPKGDIFSKFFAGQI